MPELIAKTALADRPALLRAKTTLCEVDLGVVTSVAPFPGQANALAMALKPLGLNFPAVNAFATLGDATFVWTGRNQAFLIGIDAPVLAGIAAVTDQSGGWAALRLSGPQAAAALMRYVPMDLRVQAFKPGLVLRTPLYHMSMILLRTGDQAFTVMVFRSMARTAWHEIEVALKSLAARAAG